MLKHRISFFLIQVLTLPIRCLSYPAVHRLGAWLGVVVFYLVPKYRKRTLSNLALVFPLKGKELRALAQLSLGNLMITCLEYAKFASEKKIARVVHCENPEVATALMEKGIPVIFFCGHQSNWEVLFLEGTSRMPGVAIGRPIKNNILYDWLLSIREKFGGKIIAPRNAIREGLRALKNKAFLGIVGDQGMPDSGFCCDFLGRRAWTSPLPAILAHRTGSPIIVATTKRIGGKYTIRYSDPIWPKPGAPLEEEVERMMKGALKLFEESIRHEPAQWLWSHNRWKQQTPEKIKRRYRHESLCIILPQEKEVFDALEPHLNTFREIYPLEFITLRVPQAFGYMRKDMDVEPYETLQDLLQEDYRFKLIFNFTPWKAVGSHYKKLAALTVVEEVPENLSEMLKRTILHAP